MEEPSSHHAQLGEERRGVADKIVAIESIAAYRSGLQIDKEVSKADAEKGLLTDLHGVGLTMASMRMSSFCDAAADATNLPGLLCSNLEEGIPIEFQGGRSPKEINPKLRIRKGSNTWYQSNVLGVSLPFHNHLSALHSRPKQFPQLLKRSSSNSIISTTAEHPLISTAIESNQISARREFREALREGGTALGHASAMHEGGLSTMGRRPDGVDFAC
ncbi:hypothetical protein MUK42_18138 [Musa troglodytarum]|uniref:Uncharacterized protein n=1 Tax=Musa troglodytarum TaxID=320322 RepID=A0A9E7G5N7_9LILI|nr:hypothetical protein MUK42_18138 [Musa troglodytarum]